jgi:hypothetical protein
MPCCKTQAPCDVQMQKDRCCSLERGPLSPTSATGIQAGATGASPNRSEKLATIVPSVHEDASGHARFADQRLWYLSPRDRSAPLYLRHSSILR